MTSETGIVLMIESEAITPCCWAQALLNRAYRVLEAWSSSEAFDIICSYPAGLVSALSLEVFFSDLTATRLARQMTKENPEMRVIASSTLRGDELPVDLPCDAVLRKPVTTEQVLAVVERFLHNEQ